MGPACDGAACILQRLPAPDETYRRLDAAACQCAAASNATTANMIELERHWARVVIECDSRYVQRNICLQRDLLALQAASLRNKAAGQALTAFYTLAGLEARRHYLELAIEETAASLARAERLDELDLDQGIDRSELETRLAAMRDQLLQAEFARLQLNGQLQKLVGCEISERDFFWPELDWSSSPREVDVAAEVADGLAHRYDLRALQLTLCQLEKTTLRVARGVLAVVDGSLGSVEPTDGWIHRLRCIRCADAETPVRCEQLAAIFADAERSATAEIKNAAYEIVLQQHRLAAARDNVALRRTRLAELEARRDVDRVTVFALSRSRGQLYEAEGQLIEQRIALELAQVKLKQAQGLLALECGFVPLLCCEGSCCGACMRTCR
jgi:hypothetical protein